MKIPLSLKNKLFYIPVILWMIVIFCFSHQPAIRSGQISGGITEMVAKAIDEILTFDINVNTLEHYIRKCGHLAEYFILGALLMFAVNKNNILLNKQVIFCVIFCVLYAVSDEIHQIFIVGRGAAVFDVLIDSVGAVAGILTVKVLIKIKV